MLCRKIPIAYRSGLAAQALPPTLRATLLHADALEAGSEDILEKCNTPREVRRFLNYLRLVAAPNDEPSREGIQELRHKIGDFDARLVKFATKGGGEEAKADEVGKFYLTQCAIFGIDPKTFLPLE